MGELTVEAAAGFADCARGTEGMLRSLCEVVSF
jgi:hypothetical protein